MAHDLLRFDDGTDAMFYVDEPPWHGLGEQLKNPPTAAEAIGAARLDWEVAKAPMFYHLTVGQTGIAPNHFALTPGFGWPNEERPLFGVVSAKYEVLQNRDAFAFFDPLVKSGYAAYETAGALGKGERVWVLARLNEDFEVGPGDRVQRFLLLSNRHDGHGAVQALFTPIRVVCQNTLCWALEDAREVFGVRHDRDLHANLKSAAEEMRARIEARYGLLREQFRRMRDLSMDDGRVSAYLADVFPEPAQPVDDRLQDGWARRRDEVFWSRRASEMLYRKGPHSRTAGRTLWGAYNAVTALVDHARPPGSRSRQPTAQLNRIWFGGGQRTKARAHELAVRLSAN